MNTPIDFSTSPEEAVVWTQLSREWASRLARCWMDVCKELKIDGVRGITSPLICHAHIVLSLLLCPDPDTGALFEAWMAAWRFRDPSSAAPVALHMMTCCEVARFASVFRMLAPALLPSDNKHPYFSCAASLPVCTDHAVFAGLSYADAHQTATQWRNILYSMTKVFGNDPRPCNADPDKNHKCPPADVCDESLLLVMLSIFSSVTCETYTAALIAMRDKMRAALLASPVPDIDHIAKLEIANPNCAPKFLKSIWAIRVGFAGTPSTEKTAVLWTMLLKSFLSVDFEDAAMALGEMRCPSESSRPVGTPAKGRGLQRSALHGFNKHPRAAKIKAVKLTRKQVLALKESKKDTKKVRPLRLKLGKGRKSDEPEDGESLGSEDTDEEEVVSEHESDKEFICDDAEEESHYSSEESEASSEESEDEPPKKKKRKEEN